MISRKYDWEQEYVAAILETDHEILAVRLRQASAVMLSRIEFLNLNYDEATDERNAITEALAGLRKLRTQRLGDCHGQARGLGFTLGETSP
jgi:hypothetical protein